MQSPPMSWSPVVDLATPMEASPEVHTDIVLTTEQKNTIVAVRMFTSSLTILGACFMIFSMVYFRKLKALSSRLILHLTISALGEGIFNLLTLITYGREAEYDTLCTFQGFATQIFQISAFLWTLVISFNLYLVVVKHKTNLQRYEPWYHGVVWSYTAIMSIIPLLAGAYGPAGVWCWIKKTGSALPLRFVTFYVPLYIMIAIMIYLYTVVIRTVNDTMAGQTDIEDSDRKRATTALARLRLYPIIFMILYIAPTINRIYNWISNDDIFVLYLAQVMTAPLLGFVNSLAYGLDEDLRRKYRIMFLKRGWFARCIGPVNPEDLEARSGSVDDEDDIYVEDPTAPPAPHQDGNVVL